MGKTMTLILAVMLLTALSHISLAQTYAADGNAPVFKGEGDKEFSQENFSEIKANILKRIEFRSKRLNEEKVCVEAAKDMSELKKCRPERPDRPGGTGGQEGKGQQKFQKPPTGTQQ